MSTPINWRQLAELVRELHHLMYASGELDKAKRQLTMLRRFLIHIPSDSQAIVAAEAFSIYHELKDEPEEAIRYRRREIQLMEELYQDIRDNEYDDATRKALLDGRDSTQLRLRKEIVRALEQRTA